MSAAYRIQMVVHSQGYYIDLPDLHGSVESARRALARERERGHKVRAVRLGAPTWRGPVYEPAPEVEDHVR